MTASALEGHWELDATDVPGVEKALMQLRKEYASAQAVQEGHAGTRCSVANLVIYAGTDEDAEHATATMQELAGRHPARTILLIASLEPGTPGVKASVSAACTLGRDGRRVCYEEIRLHASGRSGPHLRSIVDPLLVADLPSILWWIGDPPFREPAFLTLAGLSNHVLVDSARFRSPGVSFERLSRLARDQAISASIGDLNWNRLRSWRYLLAQLFDPPAMLDFLPRVRRVSLEVATSGMQSHPVSAQALLLAGWLAERLDWQPGPRGEQTFAGSARMRLRGGGSGVVVELRSEFRENTAPGTVLAMRIEAGDDFPHAALAITHAIGEEHAYTSVSIDGAPPTERTVRFLSPTEPLLLSQEIETVERDPVFENAVESAARLATLLPDVTR